MRRERGGTRRWRWSHRAEEDAARSPGTADQSEPAERNESPEPEGREPESPEPEATRSGSLGDPFDQVLRHAAESRAERVDEKD